MLHEKLDRFEERINELEDERKIEINERKENEKRLKEMYEERLRVIHESHLIDLKQSTEVQKIKMNHLEEVESSLRDLKPKRLTSDEMTAREISISAQDKQLKGIYLYNTIALIKCIYCLFTLINCIFIFFQITIPYKNHTFIKQHSH